MGLKELLNTPIHQAIDDYKARRAARIIMGHSTIDNDVKIKIAEQFEKEGIWQRTISDPVELIGIMVLFSVAIALLFWSIWASLAWIILVTIMVINRIKAGNE